VALMAMEEALVRVAAALPQMDLLSAVDPAGLHRQRLGVPAWNVPSTDLSGLPTSLTHYSLPPAASFDPALLQSALWAALNLPGKDVPTAATSVRLPAEIHAVARHAVDAGWASSITELIVAGLRRHLGALAASALGDAALTEVRSTLEEHYAAHPDARPPLTMVVRSAAELEGHPAAEHPDLITQAVEDLGEDSYIEDVLAWVKGAIAHKSPGTAKPRRKAAKAS
jgi:hypothetical protein